MSSSTIKVSGTHQTWTSDPIKAGPSRTGHIIFDCPENTTTSGYHIHISFVDANGNVVQDLPIKDMQTGRVNEDVEIPEGFSGTVKLEIWTDPLLDNSFTENVTATWSDDLTFNPPPEQDKKDFPFFEKFKDYTSDLGRGPWQSAGNLISPLVLDLNGNGIELTNIASKSVFFDLNHDGFAEKSSWTTGGDGLLAIDANNDGVINNSTELFGDQTGYSNGFLALKTYDSNGDGKITAEDSAWADLKVWVDANGNGISEANELNSMSDLGITSIDLGYIDANQVISGNDIKQTSTFTINGQTNGIVDAYLQTDTMITIYDQNYNFDTKVVGLPDLRGYGRLPELFIAMSVDNNALNPSSLFSLVKDFANKNFVDYFTANADIVSEVKDILYRWAGVDGVSSTARGRNFDAQELEFMEKLFGEDFLQLGSYPNPGPTAAAALDGIFTSVFNHFYANLVAQTAGSDLFSNSTGYDVANDGIQNITGLNLTNLATLATTANALGTTVAKETFWDNVVRVIEYTIGTANLSPGDNTALSNAIHTSDATLTLAKIVADLTVDPNLGSTYNGTSSADTLTGGTLNDVINGFDGNDTLTGGAGADSIVGGNGNDTLVGGLGNDYSQGGAGDDVYTYNAGDGYDTIYDTSGTDKIVFGPGIVLANLTLTRSANGDLTISIDNGTYQGEIQVYNHFANGASVETIQFNDLSTLSLTGLNWTLNGTANGENLYGVQFNGGNTDVINGNDGNDKIFGYDGADTLHGNNGDDVIYGGIDNDVAYGDAGRDVIYGQNGDDTLFGGDGDDTIYSGFGTDTLEGGNGNDLYVGSNGSDRYNFTAGHDVIREGGGSAPDDIYLPSGILAANTNYYKVGADLKISFDDNNDITIYRFFSNKGFQVETLHFFDGTTVNLPTVPTSIAGDDNANTITGGTGNDKVHGFGGNDVLDGANGDDTMFGDTGNDTLSGSNGNDTLDGGTGDDTMYGGAGDDVFKFTSGHDVVIDTGTTTSDVLVLAPGWTAADVKFEYYVGNGNDETITLSPGNSIRLADQFLSGAADKIETLKFDDGTTLDIQVQSVTQYGTAGADSFVGVAHGASLNDVIYGYDGNDTVTADNGDDTVYGGSGDDNINGGASNDTLDGGDGNDTLTGYFDDDTYIYSAGNDTYVESGSGNDKILVNDTSILPTSVSYEAHSGSNSFFINFGTSQIEIYRYYTGAAAEIETITFASTGETVTLATVQVSLTGTTGSDVLTASATALNVYGGAGNDTLTGTNGDNILNGGAGDDTMTGGGGNDTYYVDSASDVLSDTSGTDNVITSLSYTLASGFENLTVLAGTSHLSLTGNTGDNTITSILAGVNTMTGGTGNDTYVIFDNLDTLVENAAEGTDTIVSSTSWTLATNFENLTLAGTTAIDGTGNSADNVLTGNSAINTLTGGTGNDTYVVANADDVLVENASEGTDTVQSSISWTLNTNFENLTLTGTADLNATGNTVINVLTGNSGNNTLDGGVGADTMIGGAGNDTYMVDNASDLVTELTGAGTDTVLSSVSTTLGSFVENLVLTGITNISGTGNTLDNLITGNSGVNTLSGSSGNDTLDGGAGADTLIGGTGNDIFVVDNASEVLTENASEGTDTVQSSVSWTLAANFENLTLTGSSNINGTGNTAINIMIGNSGVNILNAGTGTIADTLDGGAGADTLIGGAGNDLYTVDNVGDVVTENTGEGTDTVQSSLNWTLATEFENLTLSGTGDINGTGNAVVNTLTGNSGNNTLDGGAGNDTLIGGLGNDTYVVDSSSDVVTEAASAGTDTVLSSATFTLGTNTENLALTGSSGINGTGNGSDNIIIGNSGVNTLSGSTGNDTLDGGSGADTLIGGTGNDIFVVDNASDVTTENAAEGTDTVQSSITWTLGSNIENLTLTGSSAINGTGNTLDNVLTGNSGINTLTGSTGNDTYVVDSTSDVLVENAAEGTDTVNSSVTWTLAANFENLVLSGTSNINGTGNSDVNVVTGNIGDNTLDGGAGTDTLIGGKGNDTYVVDSTSEVITENASEGTDTVSSSVSYTLTNANLENLTLTGAVAVIGAGNALDNILIGNGIVNTLIGSGGNDTLDGGAGADSLTGGTGDDLYIVDAADVITESASQGTDSVLASLSFTLATNVENLTLTGTGNFNGTGNASVNVITGNSGDNTLDGSTGADTLIGGTGNDTYIVDNAADVITENASSGTDTVQSTISYILGTNIENLTLTSGVINGTGNAEVNIITGNSSVNTLDGGAGADTLIGGAGNDVYIVDNASDVVTENAAEGTDTIQSSVSWTLSTNVENLTLTGVGSINGTGNSSVNVINGNIGNNTLDGGTGNDTMAGSAGDDFYFVDSTSDVVTESANEGVDVVFASATFTLGSNVENLTLTGSGNINGTGQASDNYIIGNSGNNTLTGNAGNDTLDGGAGNDTLIGGANDDLYIVDSGDTVTEAASSGTDTVQAGFSYTLGANVENLILTGTSNINGTGNTLDNIITGNGGINTLNGGTGNDTYIIDNASAVIVENASEGTDSVQSSVSYTLASNVENLTLTGAEDTNATGNTLDNVLTGNEGINTISGSSGNDTMDGGLGADTLIGGTGNDLYIVDADDTLVENASEGTDTVQASVSWTLAAEFENLTLMGNFPINGTGNSAVNIITGNSGINTLDGGAGADTLIGGAGNDAYIVDDVSDVVTEGASAGTDTVFSSVTFTLASNVENLTLVGSSAINAIGNSLDNVLTGNTGANTLTGGTGNDTYVTDGTSDVLVENAAEGTDLVQSSVTFTLGTNFENLTLTGTGAINGIGNSVVNTITGNTGDNSLDGGSGADTLIGGSGSDTYTVDDIGDVVIETSGGGLDTVLSSISYTLLSDVENLTLTGSSAINATGNSTDNVLTGNSGANTLTGGAGNDTYIIDNLDTLVEGSNAGIDTVQANFTYTLATNFENLTLLGASAINGTGNSADNYILGNSTVNVLTGNDGNDTLDGGVGADTMIGGLGNDTFLVDNSSDVVTESASSGTDTVQSSVAWTLGSDIENLMLTGSSAINGTGNSLDNIITGNSEVNTLTGSGGNDTLDGGLGNDTMIGGTGNDIYFIDNASDVVTENASEGTDTINSLVTWTLATNFENLTLIGGADINGTGTSGDNIIFGNFGANTLTALGGNDTLDGGYGVDTMIGGTGNDVYYVDNASDVVTENASEGTDTVHASVSWTLGTNFENLTLNEGYTINATGNSVDNILIGNSSVNVMTGAAGNDTLDGGVGADTLIGGVGNDIYIVDHVSDIVIENVSEGTDTIQSSITWTLGNNVENLTLTGALGINGNGNGLDNVMTGNGANNVLFGDAGNDTLDGGLGSDTLTGGLGSDVFVFKAASSYVNIDTISDFNTSQGDKIDLRDLLSGYDPATKILTDFVKIEDSGGNSIISVDQDGTGATYGWQQVGTILGVTGLTDEAALVTSGNLLAH